MKTNDNQSHPRCPDPEQYVSFAEGTLNAFARYRVQRHLRTCPDCAVLALRLIRTMAPEKKEPVHLRSTSWVRPQVGGLALAACCGALVTFVAMPRTTLPPSEQEATISVALKGDEASLTGAAGAVARCLHPAASQLPEAIEELEAVAKLYPNDPLLYEALARNYEQQGRLAQTPAKREVAKFKANDARTRVQRLRKM
jgi:hypothetical protein